MNISQLLHNNQSWADQQIADDPEFFQRLSQIQAPEYLWIGCADSRVPANQIVGMAPGELFVHRNVANLVVHTDLNCLSVIQFAVQVLKVKHIIVCGHYGCGGVTAALFHKELGLIENWLRHIQDTIGVHERLLDSLECPRDRTNRLCEINVIEQVMNVCRTTITRDAWRQGQSLAVHGWIYALTDGRLQDLQISVESPDQMQKAYETAISSLGSRSLPQS
ncbi:carbonate dehydratase [Rubripirellula amarantea]|nr:carbonate dehydratase [Rubripirellula amarantea]